MRNGSIGDSASLAPIPPRTIGGMPIAEVSSRMRRVALIGYGAIGAAIVDAWPNELADRLALRLLLVRSGQVARARRATGEGTIVTDDPQCLLDESAEIVIEAAGHDAVRQFGEALLDQGRKLLILSAGALASDQLYERLVRAAGRGNGRLVILPGALAGFDGLRSMGAGTLSFVKYTSIKPCAAWRGTPAEALLPARGQTGARTVFIGSAREVCHAFPRNANLAASIAIAGLGFDRTTVELIADPGIEQNSGRLQAKSDSAELDLTLTGYGFEENPKSSRITAQSAVAALRDLCSPIAFH